MQFHNNHNKSRAIQWKSSAQAQEQVQFMFTYARFGRFTRFNRWMPKILLIPVLIIVVLAAGFLIISKSIKIHTDPTKSMNINTIL